MQRRKSEDCDATEQSRSDERPRRQTFILVGFARTYIELQSLHQNRKYVYSKSIEESMYNIGLEKVSILQSIYLFKIYYMANLGIFITRIVFSKFV